MAEQLRIEYDDDALAIMEKVNEALKEYRLKFVDDDQDHDGFELFSLQGPTCPLCGAMACRGHELPDGPSVGDVTRSG